MHFRLEYRTCRRRFHSPLETAHGRWSVRESIILKLYAVDGGSDGACGFGEVAPVPGFPGDTLEEISRRLASLSQSDAMCWNQWQEAVSESRVRTGSQSFSAAFRLPPVRFAVDAALQQLLPQLEDRPGGAVNLEGDYTPDPRQPVRTALLRGGLVDNANSLRAVGNELPLVSCESSRQAGGAIGSERDKIDLVVKLKIAHNAHEEELDAFRHLASALPAGVKLRLDANGGLSLDEMRRWLECLNPFHENVDYLEQPLPAGGQNIGAMAALAAAHGISVALDEDCVRPPGAATMPYLCEWKGPLVVKPALFGSRADFRSFLKAVGSSGGSRKRIIVSSVFESATGFASVLDWAAQFGESDEWHGLGVNHLVESAPLALSSTATQPSNNTGPVGGVAGTIDSRNQQIPSCPETRLYPCGLSQRLAEAKALWNQLPPQ